MELKHYILDADNRVVEVSPLGWAKWFEDNDNRVVGYTQITSETSVSTVFIGIDHGFIGDGPPLLFETIIFGGPLDQHMWHYSSQDDALAGHAAAVAAVTVLIKRMKRPEKSMKQSPAARKARKP
jgi:hypothetical protein